VASLIFVHVYTYVQVHIRIHACVPACTCAHVHVCMYTRARWRMHIRLSVCANASACAHACIDACTYAHIPPPPDTHATRCHHTHPTPHTITPTSPPTTISPRAHMQRATNNNAPTINTEHQTTYHKKNNSGVLPSHM
jgi:hypothetical protein